MITLALETTAERCSVALKVGGAAPIERSFMHEMRLLARLTDEVEQLLRDSNLCLTNVERLVVCTGPGSFTGTRIGLVTAKVWAATLSIPIVGISMLEAIAHLARDEAAVCSLIRALPGMAYVGLWIAGKPAAEPAMLSAAALAELLARSQQPIWTLCGPGVDTLTAEIETECGRLGVITTTVDIGPISALTLIEMAEHFGRDGRSTDAQSISAAYVAPPRTAPPKVSTASAMSRSEAAQ